MLNNKDLASGIDQYAKMLDASLEALQQRHRSQNKLRYLARHIKPDMSQRGIDDSLRSEDYSKFMLANFFCLAVCAAGFVTLFYFAVQSGKDNREQFGVLESNENYDDCMVYEEDGSFGTYEIHPLHCNVAYSRVSCGCEESPPAHEWCDDYSNKYKECRSSYLSLVGFSVSLFPMLGILCLALRPLLEKKYGAFGQVLLYIANLPVVGLKALVGEYEACTNVDEKQAIVDVLKELVAAYGKCLRCENEFSDISVLLLKDIEVISVDDLQAVIKVIQPEISAYLTSLLDVESRQNNLEVSPEVVIAINKRLENAKVIFSRPPSLPVNSINSTAGDYIRMDEPKRVGCCPCRF